MKITDERYVPGAFDLCTGYEHIHRYLFTLPFIKGKRVLDLASGEGYGANLLAKEALEVVGIDISDEAVAHANRIYAKENLSFKTGSIEAIPLDTLFDVVVCFEAIEHIQHQDQLCKEVKRLLKKEGIFLVSTPNKWVYSENGITQNPYHLKELDLGELETLLKQNFKNVSFYGQKTVTSSRIFSLSESINAVEEMRIQMNEKGFCSTMEEDPSPRYFLALASDQPIEAFNGVSYLTDVADRKGFAQWIQPTPLSLLQRILKKSGLL